jgi:hypothetical protein
VTSGNGKQFPRVGGDTVGHKHSIGMRETVMNSSVIPHSTSCGRNRTVPRLLVAASPTILVAAMRVGAGWVQPPQAHAVCEVNCAPPLDPQPTAAPPPPADPPPAAAPAPVTSELFARSAFRDAIKAGRSRRRLLLSTALLSTAALMRRLNEGETP